ncbi:phage portal protein [Sphingomonas sanguinis]|uniref:phage portal protein n=1 Tax=Sphingomonas sanguinis TaxID=33051 RepID=UPI00214B1FC3|nr:phage portal protein [Sphingomonas sanguinis]
MERPDTISSDASWDEWSSFLGYGNERAQLPHVTIATALEVPAVLDAVTFLSRTLASLPLHAFREGEDKTEKVDGDLQMLLNEAPNAEWSSFAFRQYFWQQVFTGGRGLAWIERRGVTPVAIWPLDPTRTSVRRKDGRKFYRCGNVEYSATDVIDVPFALKANQLDAYGPIHMGRKAIGLAIAMNDFAAGFFVGGGIPPLALEGPLPQGLEAFKRALADIRRAIDLAKRAGQSFFGLPPGHKLTPVGADPAKGQMTEARLFQIQEIARLFGLPPVFLQDLSKGTFSNTEQQDLQLVKHLVGQWAKALEDELNLKLFGQRRRSRKVKHNMDGLQRGDFKSRTEGLARAIQTGQITPNEARALENRPPLPNGDQLYIQGATVPLGHQPASMGHNGGPPLNDDEEADGDKEAA